MERKTLATTEALVDRATLRDAEELLAAYAAFSATAARLAVAR